MDSERKENSRYLNGVENTIAIIFIEHNPEFISQINLVNPSGVEGASNHFVLR